MEGNFHRFKTGSLDNGHLRLDYLSEAGPRLVRLIPAGGENLLVDLPDLSGPDTPYGTYHIIGGHRLWHSPESIPRTYIPDDTGVQAEQLSNGVRLVQPQEPGTGMGKTIQVEIASDRAQLTVTHTLTNHNLWPVELAPWAITQLELGGTIIMPDQVGPLDPHGLLANRTLSLWSYTSWQDPRLEFTDDYLLLHANPALPPAKFGYFNRTGWIAYYRAGTLFVKRIAVQPDLPHADNGCNAETYCNNRFVELESLGPLTTLQPEQSTSHVELWELTSGLDYPQTADGIRAMARDLQLSAA